MKNCKSSEDRFYVWEDTNFFIVLERKNHAAFRCGSQDFYSAEVNGRN